MLGNLDWFMQRAIPLISAVLFLSPAVFAYEEPSLFECADQASHYKEEAQEKRRQVEPICAIVFERHAAPHASRKTRDGKISVVGHMNFVIFHKWRDIPGGKMADDTYFAGPRSRLSSVQLVAIDANNHEFAVLDGAKEPRVLVYSFKQISDPSPVRVLESPEFAGATDLVIDPRRHELWVIKGKNESLLAFDFKTKGAVKSRRTINEAKGVEAALKKLRTALGGAAAF
jgi:hypothetical protein